MLFNANKNQWFWFDEWNFIANRGPEDQAIGLFTPHNEHWSTIPALIYKGLLATVGLDSYMPYVGVLILLHLALAHVLWRASLRVGARPAIATVVAAVFALLGAGYENLIWAFQMGFVGSVLFGWIAVVLHDHDGRFDRRDLAGWAAAIVALMFSSPAVLMVGVAGLTVLLRRRRLLDAAVTVSVPMLVFGVWYLVAGRHAGDAHSEGDGWEVIDFMWSGLTNLAESVVGIRGSGAVLILAMLYWWARHLELARGRAALAAAGAVGALAFFLLTANRRGGFGVEAASASRYLYIGVALLIPSVALVVSSVLPASRASTAAISVVCGLVMVHNVGILQEHVSGEMGVEQALKRQVAAGGRMVERGDVLMDLSLAPAEAPNLTTAHLRRLETDGWLPDVASEPIDDLSAQLAWQVGLVHEPGELGDVSLTPSVGVAVVTDDGGCVALTPNSTKSNVSIRGHQPQWRVRAEWQRPDRGGDVAFYDFQLSDGELVTQPTPTPVASGETRYLLSEASERTVVLGLPPGTTTICARSLQLD